MIRRLFSSKSFAFCSLVLVIGFFIGYYYSVVDFTSKNQTVIKTESKVTQNKKPVEIIKNEQNKPQNDERP